MGTIAPAQRRERLRRRCREGLSKRRSLLHLFLTLFSFSSSNNNSNKQCSVFCHAQEEEKGRRVLRPDGYFNAVPVHYRTMDEHFYSTTHCVGEDFPVSDVSWHYRSCQFRNLCYNVQTKEFVLFPSPHETRLQQLLAQRQTKPFHVDVTISSLSQSSSGSNNNVTVSVGPIRTFPIVKKDDNDQELAAEDAQQKNEQLQKDILRYLQWFPRIIPADNVKERPAGYYELPQHVVWIPHSSAATAAAALDESMRRDELALRFLWDDLLPIYTLLSVFGLVPDDGATTTTTTSTTGGNKKKTLLMLLRMMNPAVAAAVHHDEEEEDDPDFQCECTAKITEMMQAVLPAMGITKAQQQMSVLAQLQLQQNTQPGGPVLQNLQSNYVCARTAAAGIGMVHDFHSYSQKGTAMNTHQVGRGATFQDFRNFLVSNLGLQQPDTKESQSFQVSIMVSAFDETQIQSMERKLQEQFAGSTNIAPVSVHVQSVTMDADGGIQLYAQTGIQSSFLVTTCDNKSAALVATFLSPGSTLIVYCNQDDNDSSSSSPRREDWTLLNHAGHIRTFWLPTKLLLNVGNHNNDETDDPVNKLVNFIVQHYEQRSWE